MSAHAECRVLENGILGPVVRVPLLPDDDEWYPKPAKKRPRELRMTPRQATLTRRRQAACLHTRRSASYWLDDAGDWLCDDCGKWL